MISVRLCFGKRSVYIQLMLDFEVSIAQMKVLNMTSMTKCRILTKGPLFMDPQVSEVGTEY